MVVEETAPGLLGPGYIIENLVEQVVGALSGMSALDRGLGAVLDAATKLVAANEVYVMMREGDQLRLRASRGLYQSLSIGATLNAGAGIEGWVVEHGDSLALSNASRDSRFVDLPGRMTLPGAMLALPMRLRGEVVGVFVAAKHERAGFSDAQRRWLAVLAQMAAVAIENDRLLSREQRRARQAEVLLQLASLDATGIDDYVQRLAEAVNGAMSVDKTEVALLDTQTGQLVSKGIAGATMAVRAQKLALNGVPLNSRGLVAHVFSSGAPLLCKETCDDPRARLELAELGIRSVLGAPILVHGEPRGVIHLATARPGSFDPDDLSFLSLVAERIGLQLEQLELAERRAEMERQRAQQEAREGFMGIVSHELKTPVAVIRAYTEVLLRRAEKEGSERAAVDVLTRVEEQAVRMLAMIEQLLDLQRIDVGLLPLERSRFDLAELARRVAEEQLLTTTKHRIVAGASDPVMVLADRRRIEEILHNLVGNAIKYSPSGGPIAVKVASSAESSEKLAIVEVADQGIGIAAKDRDRIFDRFFQAAGTPYKGRVGLGLGLYISKELVTRHGGAMWVESEPRKGSSFFFTLPLLRTADEECQEDQH